VSFLTRWVTVSLSRRTLLHGVNWLVESVEYQALTWLQLLLLWIRTDFDGRRLNLLKMIGWYTTFYNCYQVFKIFTMRNIDKPLEFQVWELQWWYFFKTAARCFNHLVGYKLFGAQYVRAASELCCWEWRPHSGWHSCQIALCVLLSGLRANTGWFFLFSCIKYHSEVSSSHRINELPNINLLSVLWVTFHWSVLKSYHSTLSDRNYIIWYFPVFVEQYTPLSYHDNSEISIEG